MRLRAGLEALSLIATGCAGLPERVLIDVDGRSIEVRQHGFGAEQLSGRWSTSEDCNVAIDLTGKGGATIHRIGPGQLQLQGADGIRKRLYSCPE